MAEIYPGNRLQPALLYRLKDEHPEKKMESREDRVISLKKFKEYVVRDLERLLNTGSLDAIQNLDGYPQVKASVLNYGIHDFAGETFNRKNYAPLERAIRQAILQFEPRLIPKSLKVRVTNRDEQNAIITKIEAELWWQPMPEQLYLTTVMDLELGSTKVKLDG